MHAVHTILHPTDFSESARYAFELACTLAGAQGGRVIALHVAVPPVVMYDESGEPLPLVEDYRQAAREELSQLQAPNPRVRIERRLGEGEVAAAILRLMQEVRPDLVVMGTHGRTGLDRLVIGSVAAEVMRKSPCAVVAVRVPTPKPATVGVDRLHAEVVGAGRE